MMNHSPAVRGDPPRLTRLSSRFHSTPGEYKQPRGARVCAGDVLSELRLVRCRTVCQQHVGELLGHGDAGRVQSTFQCNSRITSCWDSFEGGLQQVIVNGDRLEQMMVSGCSTAHAPATDDRVQSCLRHLQQHRLRTWLLLHKDLRCTVSDIPSRSCDQPEDLGGRLSMGVVAGVDTDFRA